MQMMKGLSNFEWLETAKAWVEETLVKRLLRWCKALRLSEVWVGDNGMASEKLCGESAREYADGSQICYGQLPVVTWRLCF